MTGSILRLSWSLAAGPPYYGNIVKKLQPRDASPPVIRGELGRLFNLLLRAQVEARDEPLTVNQRAAIAVIADRGPLRLNELAAVMRATPPTASRAVDGLVNAKLITRVEDERDRRAVRLAVTRKGRAHVDRYRARATALLEPALAELSPEDRAALLDIVLRLNARLSGSAPDDPEAAK